MGSCEPEPLSVMKAPSLTSDGPAAKATGSFDSLSSTVITTDILSGVVPSLTVNVNVRGVACLTIGVVNEAVSLSDDRSTACVPPVWLQTYVKGSLFGSDDSEPSSVIRTASPAFRSPPVITAWGALESASRMIITTSSVCQLPRESVTLSVNVRDRSDATTGMANDAPDVAAPDSETAGVPPVWLQRYDRVSWGFISDEAEPSSTTSMPPSR